MATVLVAGAKAKDVAKVELADLISEFDIPEVLQDHFSNCVLKLVIKSAIAGAEHLKKVEQIEADLKITVSGE